MSRDDLIETVIALDKALRTATAERDECEEASLSYHRAMEKAEAERDAAAERLESSLAAMYPAHYALIAELCDEHLDRSGGLLGRVRDRALRAGGVDG